MELVSFLWNSEWWGKEANVRVVLEKGTYKFVFRTLRVGGNRNRNDHWQTVITPEFTLLPPV